MTDLLLILVMTPFVWFGFHLMKEVDDFIIAGRVRPEPTVKKKSKHHTAKVVFIKQFDDSHSWQKI